MTWCFVCDHAVRAAAREIPELDVAALVLMGQLEVEAVGRPMCAPCFDGFQAILAEVEVGTTDAVGGRRVEVGGLGELRPGSAMQKANEAAARASRTSVA